MLNGIAPGPSLWIALILAAALGVFFFVARWRYVSIPRLPLGPADAPHPDCMVIIPARNEELLIAAAVKSLPADTVIVVDDHSTDRTAAIARKAGAGVLEAPEMMRGVIGKPNACMAGARLLQSKWVLFTDADTRFEAGFLPAVVACAEANQVDFLSIYLRPQWQTWKDALLFPYAQALFFCGVSPKSDPTCVFNGQCLLVRREPYEFVGAHAAVMNTLTDDVKLAALARRHRLHFAVIRAEKLGSVVLRQCSETMARGAYRFMAISGWMGATLIAAALVMALWLPVAAWLYVDGNLYAALALAFLPVVLTWPWYRNVLRALLAPVAVYAIVPALFGGFTTALSGSKVEWKGREI